MTDSKVLDTSVWLEYLFNKNFEEIINEEVPIVISSLSIFEIKRKLTKSKLSEGDITKSLEFVKKRSLIIPVTTEISEKAAHESLIHNLHMADAIIYTTAIENNSKVHTIDNDFRGLADAVVLE